MRKCRKCGKEYSGKEKFCSLDGAPLVDVEAFVDEPGDPLLGKVINNRYRVVERLGEGGMSVVYRAVQEGLGRDVAIKFLKDKLATRVGSVERFIVEARASSKVDHPNIVSVFDFGRDPEGRYFMVMEYVDGVQLIKLIKQTGAFDQHRVILILRQLFMAVGAAHAAGIVHRDLKPENVLCLRRHGTVEHVKILDFGLAKFLGNELRSGKLTRHGVILGTPFYMSPEQAQGGPVDSRADLYSIGVMGYEMLTGTVPFVGTSAAVVIDHHVRTPPTPPRERRPDLEIHPDLELFVLTLLSKLPALRYQTAEISVDQLDKIERKLHEVPLTKEDLVRHTRPLFGLQTPFTSPGAPSPLSRRRGRGEQTPTTVWDSPGLLDDSSRMARLWDDRITQVADQVWGADQWPDWVSQAVESIRTIEQAIKKQEAEIALLRKEIAAVEDKARDQEASLRFKRLDLVARHCVLLVAVSDEPREADEQLFSSATVELDEQDEPPTQAGDRKEMRALCDKIEKQIDDIDRRARLVTSKNKETMEQYQRTVTTKLRQIWALRQRQVPLCSDLVTRLNAVAVERRDCGDAVTALAEVTGALQVYQALLRAVRQSSSTSQERIT